MKLSIFALLALFTTAVAFADGAPALSVKINSFTHVGDTNSTLGEVCGSVNVKNTIIPVTVTADPTSSDPGMYTVLADPNGNFCTLINTYLGSAEAQAWLPSGHSAAKSLIAHLGDR